MPERGSKTSTVPVLWANSEFFRRDPIYFLSRLVTMDETRLYHYDLETKQQSMEWWHSGSPRPQEFRVQKSDEKSSRFFGIKTKSSSLIIFQRPKLSTINSSLLVQLKDILREKTPRESHQCGLVLARQCPGSPGTCNPEDTGLPVLPMSWSPTQFSGSSPSDYHLFPELQKQLKGRHFSSEAEVIAAEETWLDGQLSEFFFGWLANLEQRAKKFIELRGEYVE